MAQQPGAQRAAPPSAAPPRPPQSKRTGTVIVASKIPQRLDLQLCEPRIEERRHRETRWTETVMAKIGPMVRIEGTAYPRGTQPEGFRDPPQKIDGYALTPGVDAEWWEEWAEQNKDSPFIKNGLIFAVRSVNDVRSRARQEFSKLRSGLDPMRPDDDPRLPKPMPGMDIEIKGSPGPTDADLAQDAE